MQVKEILSLVGPLFCPDLRTFYPGHDLWDSVQNKNAKLLVQNYKFQDGNNRALNNHGALLNREPCITMQL